MTKTWTKAEALPILQKAYRDKILSAQNGGQECLYRSDAGPCIIGVLLDDQTAEKWDQMGSAGSVSVGAVKRGDESISTARAAVLDAFHYDDLAWFAAIQTAHDLAIQHPGTDVYFNEIEALLELR